MNRRTRAVLLTSAGAVACVVVAALMVWNRAGSPARAAPSSKPEQSAATGSPAPSSLPLAEAIPPPPSLAEAHAESRKLSSPCEALRLENERSYEQSRQRLGADSVCSLNVVVDALGCTTATNGVTWGYRLATATAASSRKAPSCRSKWRIELVRENPAGEKTIARGGDLSFDLGEYDSASVQLQGLSDYDGDGEPELLRNVYRKAHEGDAESVALVFSYRAGRFEQYAPSRAVPIVKVEDVDGDGLLDLVGPGPYRSISTESDIGTNVSIAPALFAHHAERDGSFSILSPASMAYTERQCPKTQMSQFVAGDLDNPSELARALVCARLWGTPAAEIEARFKLICPATPDATGDEEAALARRSCRKWVVDLARVAPPFTLTKAAP